MRDFTEGSVFKSIAVFSAPFFLTYFLQTFYGMADLLLVGRFSSAKTIAAVAVGSQVMHMLTVVIVGLSMGVTILSARAVGEKNISKLSRILGNSSLIFFTFGILSTVFLLLFCPQIVSLMKTPPEAFREAEIYLFLCFAGLPAIIVYNAIAAIFRGMGDSKRPMYFALIACATNLLLDLILIGAFHWGALGAALATVISQVGASFISLISLRRHLPVSLSRSDFKPDKNLIQKMLSVGIPIALQDGFIQISFLLITMIANSRGVEIAAAVGIVEKIICFLFLVPSAMLSTISALAAQNFGAQKYERAKSVFFQGTFFACGVGILFACLFQFLAEPVVSLFSDEMAVSIFATQYLRTYVIDCFFASLHFCFSGYFCASGLAFLSFIHNAFSIVLFRIPGTYLASKFFPDNLAPMGLAAPLGSLFSVIFCLIAYFICVRRGLFFKRMSESAL